MSQFSKDPRGQQEMNQKTNNMAFTKKGVKILAVLIIIGIGYGMIGIIIDTLELVVFAMVDMFASLLLIIYITKKPIGYHGLTKLKEPKK